MTVVDAAAVADGRFAPTSAPGRDADPALDHDDPIEELFEDQLRCADLVVVSKADLARRRRARPASRRSFAARRGRARRRSAAAKGLPAEVLLGLGVGAEDDMAGRESHHELEGEEHDHDDFDSFVVEAPAFASLEALARAGRARRWRVPGVLRIKGRARVAGKPAAGRRPGASARGSRPISTRRRGSDRLVVIGLRDMDRAAVAAHLAG